jgi:undecaprenyl-diphosphatase
VVATPLLARPTAEVLRRRADRADSPVPKLASRSRP